MSPPDPDADVIEERPRAPSGDEVAGGRETHRWIGKPFRRVDGRAKVTGVTRFADDLVFPRMVHLRLVRSTKPHARIVRVDDSRAREVDGFLHMLTGAEFPETFGILPVSQDEHALCVERVRFVGDPVGGGRGADRGRGRRGGARRRGRARAAAHDLVGRRGARAGRAADPRLRRRRQRPQEDLDALRRRRGGLRRGGRGLRGRPVLRRQYPPADGAARPR